MLLEEKTKAFMDNEEIDSIEDIPDGDIRTIRASIVKEIAKKLYGGIIQLANERLRIGSLGDKVQILLKRVSERTPEEIEYLKFHGISKDFVMNKEGLLIIREIEKKFFGDSKESFETQKVFEMIKKSGIDKHSYGMQNIILKDIRDELKKGKSFELVMEEIKTIKEKFSMDSLLEKYTYRINIPTEYRRWHKKACTEARKTDAELIYYIYLTWLKKEAEKNNW